MSLIVWDSYLEVGHSIIDEQHRILADVLNQLYTATKSHQGRKEIEDLLVLFRECTEIHYRFEEGLMEVNLYTDAAQHHAVHQALLRQLDDLVAAYRQGTLEVTTKVLHFLQEWLVSHIVKEDQQLGRFMRRQQKGNGLYSLAAELVVPAASPQNEGLR